MIAYSQVIVLKKKNIYIYIFILKGNVCIFIFCRNICFTCCLYKFKRTLTCIYQHKIDKYIQLYMCLHKRKKSANILAFIFLRFGLATDLKSSPLSIAQIPRFPQYVCVYVRVWMIGCVCERYVCIYILYILCVCVCVGVSVCLCMCEWRSLVFIWYIYGMELWWWNMYVIFDVFKCFFVFLMNGGCGRVSQEWRVLHSSHLWLLLLYLVVCCCCCCCGTKF